MTMKVLLGALLLLAVTSYSSATYCLCKEGVGKSQMQAALDYACGALADCTLIQPNAACYEPNTVKSHCDYAVNSYYQKAGQAAGSCYFSGAAAVSDTLPSTVAAGCVYPSSPGNARTPPKSTTPPSETPPTGGDPGSGAVPGTPAGGGGPGSDVNPGTPAGGGGPGSDVNPGTPAGGGGPGSGLIPGTPADGGGPGSGVNPGTPASGCPRTNVPGTATGGTGKRSGATCLYISYALTTTLSFAALLFLWGR